MADVVQHSEAWHKARCGRITASQFGAAMAVGEGGFYKSGPRKGQPKPTSTAERDKYMRVLAFERLSGTPVHEINSRSLSWGTDVEQFSREAFELETGLLVTPAEFLAHPVYPFIGASPDGLPSDGSGLEMKAPHDEAVHIQTILEGMPDDHIPQVQGGMFVTGKSHWWFASYDPRQAEKYRLYVQRIPRDDAYIARLAAGLLQFEAELKALLQEIDERVNLRAAA